MILTGVATAAALVANEIERSGADASAAGATQAASREVSPAPVASDPEAWRLRMSAALRHRTKELQHCYQHALRGEPDLGGRIAFTIGIDPSGQVEVVDVDEDTLGSPAVSACARAKIEGWRLPPERLALPSVLSFTVAFSGGSRAP